MSNSTPDDRPIESTAAQRPGSPAAEPKRRWYRLTTDRYLVGLLGLLTFLLLSEWLNWLPRNETRVWTIVITAATVCVALLVMLLSCGASLLFRRRFQFSLRSLMLLVLAVAVVCSWYSVKRRQATAQREAIEAIEKVGGMAMYEYTRDPTDGHNIMRTAGFDGSPRLPGPRWVHASIAKDIVYRVAGVQMYIYRGMESKESPFDDRLLAHLEAFPHLRQLVVIDGNVTDRGLTHLRGLQEIENLVLTGCPIAGDGFEHLRLPELEYLDLCGTSFTDCGLKHLAELTSLQDLRLGHTDATDKGLKHLAGLTQLQDLRLEDTDVTDEGLKHLQGMVALQTLVLGSTRVTDAGMRYVTKLPKLEALSLDDTDVTDAGLAQLRVLTGIRDLGIGGTRVTDVGLVHVKGLAKLEIVTLTGTSVTDDGLANLRSLANLRELFLVKTGIGDAGLEHLAGLTNLEIVALQDSQVTVEGMRKLQEALPNCQLRHASVPP